MHKPFTYQGLIQSEECYLTWPVQKIGKHMKASSTSMFSRRTAAMNDHTLYLNDIQHFTHQW